NMAIIADPPRSDGGANPLAIFNAGGNVHVIVDTLGYFVADDASTTGFVVCDRHPRRVFDSRTQGGKLAAGSRISLSVGDRDSVAMLNVTVTGPEAPGFVSVLPSANAPITTSTTNYLAGETRANLTFAKLDGDGSAGFFTASTSHLIIDRVASLLPHGRACPTSADFGRAGASFL